MTNFSIYLLIAGSAIGFINANHLKGIIKDCIDGHEAPPSDLALLMGFKVPETESGKCMLHCIMHKLGHLKEDGMLDRETLEAAGKKYLSDEKIRAKSNEILDQCIKDQKTDGTKCDKGVSGYQCLTEKHIEAGIKDTMDTIVADLLEA